jgi:hypothetical protein
MGRDSYILSTHTMVFRRKTGMIHYGTAKHGSATSTASKRAQWTIVRRSVRAELVFRRSRASTYEFIRQIALNLGSAYARKRVGRGGFLLCEHDRHFMARLV